MADDTAVATARALPRAAFLQFVRYVVVGAGNTTVSYVVYRLLLAGHVPYLLAAPIAFLAGAVNGYFFNRRWTFAAADTTRSRVLYFGLTGLGALWTTVLVSIIVEVAGVDRVWAYLVAVPPVTVTMFLANRFWTFAER